MATIRSLLKVGGDADDAKRALRETREELRQFGQITAEAKAQIKTDAAQLQLEALHQRLERLSRQEATPKVKLAMARAIEQIDRLEAKLAALGARSVTVDVDVKRGAGERLASGLSRIVSGALGALGSLPGIGSLFGSLASGASTLGSAGAAGAAGIVALGTAGAALLAGFLLLIPVVIALGASLVGAAAGAGVLAAAFGAALIAPVGIGIGVVAELTKILKALGEEETQQTQNAGAAQAAAEQRAAAQQALADAYRNVREQAAAARQAQEDASRAIPRDKLALDEAKLRKREADKAVRDFRNQSGTSGQSFDSLFRRFSDVNFKGDPSQIVAALKKQGAQVTGDDGLKLKRLLLDQRGAVLGVSDALHKLHIDQQRNSEFATKGLHAYAPYNAALRQVATAQRQVAAATQAANTQQGNQAKSLEKLTPHERRIAGVLRGIKDAFEEAFTPAVNKALSGLVSALGSIAKVFESPRIRRALSSLGKALGEQFARFGQFLADPANQRALVTFIDAGRKLVKPLTTLFISFAKVLRDLAGDALPKIVSGVKKFSGEVRSWEKHEGGAKKLKGTVKTLIASFNDWVKIVEGLGLILVAFLRGAKDDGDSFAGSLGDVLVQWGKFLNTKEGQKGIKDFFHDVRHLIKLAITELEHLISLWNKVADAKDKSGSTLNTIARIIIDPIGGTNDLIRGTVAKPKKPRTIKPVHLTPPRPKLSPPHAPSGRRLAAAFGLTDLVGSLSSLGGPMDLAAAASSDGGGTTVHAPITVVGGGPPEPEVLSELLERKLQRLGRGR